MNTRLPIAKTFWYCYQDTNYGDPFEDNFGFLNQSQVALPAFYHYQGLGGAQSDFNLQAIYPTQTPTALTLYYLPETTGDGSHVTNYPLPSGTNRQIAAGTYMYYSVNDNWLYKSDSGIDTIAYADVTVLDTGTGNWYLQYDGTSNAYTNVSAAYGNMGGWVTKTLTLTNVYFGNRQNWGADLRIGASSGGP